MSIGKYAKLFVDYCAIERQLSENTLQAYMQDLTDFGRWCPATCDPLRIQTDTLREYLEDMKGRRALSPATIRRRIACLRAFFRFLADQGQMADPFVGWRLKLPRRKRLPRALSRDETSTLLASTRDLERAKALEVTRLLRTEVSLMVATGIRVGELCKIQTGDVSHDGSTLRIHGKGSRDRIVYVANPDLRVELTKLVALRQRMLDGPGPLFVNRHGASLRPHAFRSKLHSFVGKVGIKRRVTPHMLRHTAATLLIESGVDIRVVQRLLGHSSIATTEIYTHVSDQALRTMLDRANVLGGLRA
ncbi:tyrosine-type recombinase/integrase [Bradyrhizobium oligotrophicum]